MSLKDKAYFTIKDKIIRCKYAPGDVLVESELMELVGASRTPIREALNKLEQERLVRILPKRGVFVTDITMATLQEVFDVRDLIEPHAVRMFGHLIPARTVSQWRESIQKLGKGSAPDQEYDYDNDLHTTLIKACNNSYIEIMMEQIYGQNTRIRILSGISSAKRFNESRDEHEVILDAMLEKDFELAGQSMKKHLDISRDVAIDALTNKKSALFLHNHSFHQHPK